MVNYLTSMAERRKHNKQRDNDSAKVRCVEAERLCLFVFQ